MNWVEGGGRADLSVAASTLLGQFNERDAKVLAELTSAVRLAKQQKATMTMHAAFSSWAASAGSDASLAQPVTATKGLLATVVRDLRGQRSGAGTSVSTVRAQAGSRGPGLKAQEERPGTCPNVC